MSIHAVAPTVATATASPARGAWRRPQPASAAPTGTTGSSRRAGAQSPCSDGARKLATSSCVAHSAARKPATTSTWIWSGTATASRSRRERHSSQMATKPRAANGAQRSIPASRSSHQPISRGQRSSTAPDAVGTERPAWRQRRRVRGQAAEEPVGEGHVEHRGEQHDLHRGEGRKAAPAAAQPAGQRRRAARGDRHERHRQPRQHGDRRRAGDREAGPWLLAHEQRGEHRAGQHRAGGRLGGDAGRRRDDRRRQAGDDRRARRPGIRAPPGGRWRPRRRTRARSARPATAARAWCRRSRRRARSAAGSRGPAARRCGRRPAPRSASAWIRRSAATPGRRTGCAGRRPHRRRSTRRSAARAPPVPTSARRVRRRGRARRSRRRTAAARWQAPGASRPDVSGARFGRPWSAPRRPAAARPRRRCRCRPSRRSGRRSCAGPSGSRAGRPPPPAGSLPAAPR